MTSAPMKAIQAAERGGYEALRLVEIPEPQPRAGQALVRVTSAGVTPLDRTVLAGLHPSARKLPLVPGNEGAGIVMNDPSGRFLAGERVLFFAGPGGVAQDGTFAEITSVPSGNLASLPGEITDEIAAGLPVAYLSAFLALRQAGFRAGQSVLAPGVGGSVGNATLKAARAFGASRLVSTAGSAAKESAAAADDGLREVDIINLQRESLADGLARLAPGGVDIVIDALGGPLTGQAIAGLARGGRVVVMGYAAGTETTMRVTDLVWKLAHVSGFSLFAASAEEQATAYATVLPLIAGGQIVPAHDRSFPLAQAPEALRYLIEDRPFGTVTLTVGALPSRLQAASPARRAVCRPCSRGDEVEQCLVDLVGVGPDDRVRPARYDDETRVLQQRGQSPAGGLVGQHPILVAVHYQDRDVDRGQIAAEVFKACGDAAERGVGRCGDGRIKAVLPGLVADPAAVQDIDVVGAVQEVFHRRRAVSGDSRRNAVEDAPLNTLGAVVRLEQEGQQRGHQHGCPDPL
jgi:NADPH:quinone reductase